MNNPSSLHGKPPSRGSRAKRILLRYVKLLSVTLLGLVSIGFGIAWLIDGIPRAPLTILAGTLAAGWPIVGYVRAVRRSGREAAAEREVTHAKSRAGLLTCRRCQIDFDVASAPTTPQPRYQLPLLVIISLLPIGFGLVMLVMLWLFDTGTTPLGERLFTSAKLLLIAAMGLVILFTAIASRNWLVVRCPTCGRACGTTKAPPRRGFPVVPVDPASKT